MIRRLPPPVPPSPKAVGGVQEPASQEARGDSPSAAAPGRKHADAGSNGPPRKTHRHGTPARPLASRKGPLARRAPGRSALLRASEPGDDEPDTRDPDGAQTQAAAPGPLAKPFSDGNAEGDGRNGGHGQEHAPGGASPGRGLRDSTAAGAAAATARPTGPKTSLSAARILSMEHRPPGDHPLVDFANALQSTAPPGSRGPGERQAINRLLDRLRRKYATPGTN